MKPLFQIVLLILLTSILAACARTEEGILVPESLPMSARSIATIPTGESMLSVEMVYDSVGRKDDVIWLMNNLDEKTERFGVRGRLVRGDDRLNSYDQMTFQMWRYPGLRRVQLAPFSTDCDGDSVVDALFYLNYDDSIVVGYANWKPPTGWVHRFSVPRTDNHYMMSLALWHVPSNGHWIFVSRKSDRLQRIRELSVDTLYFFDLTEGRCTVIRPVGAFYRPMAGGMIQFDSLLILNGTPSNNGLGYGGLDDSHSYLVAYRQDGSIAWVDTLWISPDRPDKCTAVDHFSRKTFLLQLVGDSITRTKATHAIVRRSMTRDTLKQALMPVQIEPWGIVSTLHPNRKERHYFLNSRGKMCAFDSTLKIISSAEFPWEFGGVYDEGGVEGEWAERGERFVDINNNGYGDFLVLSARHQLIVLDGGTLQPLLATRSFEHVSQWGFARDGDERMHLIVLEGSTLESLNITPTPLWDRIWVHSDRILTALLLFLILPAFAYFLWRVEYSRQLFRLLISESDRQGVMVLKLISPPKNLLGKLHIGKEHGENISVISANESIKRMFSIPLTLQPAMSDFPTSVSTTIETCLGSAENNTLELDIPTEGTPRRLVINVRSMKLFRRFRRSVMTVIDITESIEAERERNAAVAEASRQRELFNTTVKVVHDAKTPLQTAQLTLNSLMSELQENGSLLISGVAEGQRAIIESSIKEAVDNINRSIYLAREMPRKRSAREIDLFAAVQSWIDKIGPRYESRGFGIRNDIPIDLPKVMLYEQGFEFLLQCACDNAVQWTPHYSAKKWVMIGGERKEKGEKEWSVLTVSDNGIGMDEETVERAMYAPGFTGREMGSGLGLLIIHKACAEHNAQLSIESRIGIGTTLHIEFLGLPEEEGE